MAKKFTAICVLSVRGAADTIAESIDLRNARLAEANAKLQAGEDPTSVPGVFWLAFDPGGGPCRDQYYPTNVPNDQSGLPEAVSRNDD